MFKTIIILSTMIVGLAAAGDAQTYTLTSGDYTVTLSPRYNHTMRSISYKGHMLAEANGFYNLVIGAESGKYCGAGHTEGGKEELLEFELTCDEKTVVPTIGQTYNGQKIVANKISRLQNTVFHTRFEFTPAGILEQKRFIATGKQNFFYFYVNLYCFNKKTTDFIAENAEGKLIIGKFGGDFPEKSRWHLNSDVKFAAIYEAPVKTGLLIYYPEIIKGTARKSAFWEVKNIYNKYYTMAAHPPVDAGFESKTYTAYLQGFICSPDELVPAVTELGKKLNEKSFPSLTLEKLNFRN